MNLIEIKSSLSCSYDDLLEYAHKGGHWGLKKQTLINFVNETHDNPRDETVEAVRDAFMDAANDWQPKLVKEILDYFKSKYNYEGE